MEIRLIEPSWSEDLVIFAEPRYLQSQSRESGWMGGASDHRTVFLLPFTIHRKFPFRYLKFHSAPLAPAGIPHTPAETEQDFLDSAVEYARRNLKVDFIAQPPTYVLSKHCPRNSIAAPFGSYRIDLSRPEDDLWTAVHSKHKNVIRNAQKNPVRIERGPHLNGTAYGLLAATMARSRIPFESERDFMETLENLSGHVETFVAFAQDEPQGCAVIPFSRAAAYYLWGGSIEKPFLGSLNLLQWEVIRHMKSTGVGIYDFVGARLDVPEGSKLEGIQRFKSRFGAVLEQGYLWKMPFHGLKTALFETARKFRHRNGPGREGDVIDQERKRFPENHPSHV